MIAEITFLLRLLENPNILEHESFTELLWATFHMTEELEVRNSLSNIAVPDTKHLLGDLKRVYGNPFDWTSTPFIQD